MTDTLRDRLGALVDDEPAFAVDLGDVLTAGGRHRHRRRALAAGGALATTALAATAVAVPLLAGGSAPRDSLAVAPFALSGVSGAATAVDRLDPQQRRLAEAIRSASPRGWTFDLGPDRWDGPNVEATADDGGGAGRLMVGVSPAPGTQLLHPCRDTEFAAGASCTETTLADGSVLSLRGVVDAHGVEYVDVTLTHPDGGGVMAEAGNFVIDWPPPAVATAQQKRDLVHTTRARPVYTVDQLAAVVVAVDDALAQPPSSR